MPSHVLVQLAAVGTDEMQRAWTSKRSPNMHLSYWPLITPSQPHKCNVHGNDNTPLVGEASKVNRTRCCQHQRVTAEHSSDAEHESVDGQSLGGLMWTYLLCNGRTKCQTSQWLGRPTC